MNFKTFLESEERKNVEKLLLKLPKGHRALLDGYKFKFTPGNTLNGDNQHIGYIHKDKVVVAAPWNYSRGFTTLHEIAHLVWEYAMTLKIKKEWSALLKQTKKKQIAKISGYLQMTLAVFGLAEVIRRFMGYEEVPAFHTTDYRMSVCPI